MMSCKLDSCSGISENRSTYNQTSFPPLLDMTKRITSFVGTSNRNLDHLLSYLENETTQNTIQLNDFRL